MERHRLTATGPEVGLIGLGTEHIESASATLEAILRAAVDMGSNYVDLLYIEEDYWRTYGAVYRAFRPHLVVAAHWGGGAEYDLDYCRRTFAQVLSSVGNDYVEVAMMTMIDDGPRAQAPWREASLEHLCRLQERGHVGLIGGSAHDPLIAAEAVRAGLLDVLMFPVNLLAHDSPPYDALFQACTEHDVALVAMKPYNGGTFFMANGQPTGITPSQCLHYLASLPAVTTTVPGPRTLAEWQATLHYLEARPEECEYGPLLRGELQTRLAGQCVCCEHCLPCPEGIDVGWVIRYVDVAQGGHVDRLREEYQRFSAKASDCTQCGICLERCPFDVDIMAKLEEAVALFES